MNTANLDHRNDYGREAQDRLGAALHRLSSLDLHSSGSDGRKNSERINADILRKINADLERAFVEMQEAAMSYERLRSSASHALQRADLLFLLSPVPCVILDRSSVIVDANPAAARAVNLSQRHLVGKPFQLFVGRDRDEFLTRLASLERGGWATKWPVVIRPRERGLLKLTFAAAVDAEDHVVAMLLPASASGEDDGPEPVDLAQVEAVQVDQR
jgi:PAS domain-containing protein